MKIFLRNAATQEDADELRRQTAEFFDGVVHHDGPPFFRHLRRDLFVLSILPGDRIIDNYDAYVVFQNEWNAKKGRALFTYEFEYLILYGSVRSTVVIRVVYEDTDPAGVPFRKTIRIKNAFVKEGDTWFLTENQNTVMTDAKRAVAGG